ncbi:MAG TPA: hypothetical protein VF715_03800 [Thermoleophilaceae bacterium]
MIRQRLRGLLSVVGGARRHLSEGLPIAFVAFLAALVLVAILYTVAEREPKELRGWAEFTMSPNGCTIDPLQRSNASFCHPLGAGIYRLVFTKPLAGRTVVASRGSCCPGRIAASIAADGSVIVVVERRLRGPVRASVLIP